MPIRVRHALFYAFISDTTLFTRVFYNHYSPPYIGGAIGQLCWDEFCGQPDLVDDPKMDGYNVEGITKDFLEWIRTVRVSRICPGPWLIITL